LLEQAIPQKGLAYKSAGHVVLVNYVKRQYWDACIENKLSYVRIGDVKGSISLAGNAPTLLLIHDEQGNYALFRLKKGEVKIFTKKELLGKGFFPSHADYYLCFMISSPNPITNIELDYKRLINKRKGSKLPHFEII